MTIIVGKLLFDQKVPPLLLNSTSITNRVALLPILRPFSGFYKANGIAYCINNFENGRTFLSKLYGRLKKVVETNEDSGAVPMQTTFEINLDEKLCFVLKKMLDTDYNYYKHFVMLILQLVGKISMLVGGAEVSVCFLFIVFLI